MPVLMEVRAESDCQLLTIQEHWRGPAPGGEH
jgi:hypothetical protein